MTHRLLNPRIRSLQRGMVLVLSSLVLALILSHFPNDRATPLLLLPALGAMIGTADTARCIQRRWSLYHGGVILCLYMDIMVISLILFLFLYPYAHWITSSQ